jgi:hypothetical protein
LGVIADRLKCLCLDRSRLYWASVAVVENSAAESIILPAFRGLQIRGDCREETSQKLHASISGVIKRPFTRAAPNAMPETSIFAYQRKPTSGESRIPAELRK